MSAHRPISQPARTVIRVGDRVRFTEDYVQSLNTQVYHELTDLQGTVTVWEPGDGTHRRVLRVRWDGDDRDRPVDLAVLERIS